MSRIEDMPNYVGHGSYGVVFANPDDPDTVIKVFEDEETYEIELSGYVRSCEIIEKYLPEYTNRFCHYIGPVIQTINSELYEYGLKFKRYDNYIKNELWSKQALIKVLKDLHSLFGLFKRMLELKISHTDVNPNNIVYEIDNEGDIRLVLCDYGCLNFNSEFEVDNCFGYFYSYTPALYWLCCIDSQNTVSNLVNNKFDINFHNSILRKYTVYNKQDIDNNRITFNNLFGTNRYCYSLMDEKFINLNKSLKLFTETFGNSLIEHYKLRTKLETTEYLEDIVRFNDLYGFCVIMCRYINKIGNKHIRGLFESLMFSIMTVEDYFQKDINSISQRFEDIMSQINENNIMEEDDLVHNTSMCSIL